MLATKLDNICVFYGTGNARSAVTMDPTRHCLARALSAYSYLTRPRNAHGFGLIWT